MGRELRWELGIEFRPPAVSRRELPRELGRELAARCATVGVSCAEWISDRGIRSGSGTRAHVRRHAHVSAHGRAHWARPRRMQTTHTPVRCASCTLALHNRNARMQAAVACRRATAPSCARIVPLPARPDVPVEGPAGHPGRSPSLAGHPLHAEREAPRAHAAHGRTGRGQDSMRIRRTTACAAARRGAAVDQRCHHHDRLRRAVH